MKDSSTECNQQTSIDIKKHVSFEFITLSDEMKTITPCPYTFQLQPWQFWHTRKQPTVRRRTNRVAPESTLATHFFKILPFGEVLLRLTVKWHRLCSMRLLKSV
jgi:hypothetical protein